MANIKDRYKCKVIITDKLTGEKIVYNLNDFNSNLSNDLISVPTYSGDFLPAPMYSRGFHVNINGYMKNPNIKKDYKDAQNEAIQRLKDKMGR